MGTRSPHLRPRRRRPPSRSPTSVPASAPAPILEPTPAPSPEQQRAAQIEQLLAEIDHLYKLRMKKGNTEASYEKAKEVLALDGQSYEAQWRIARTAYWIADGSEDKQLKEKWGKIGLEAGTAGVELKPGRVEAQFWGAASLGHYAKGVGVMKAFWDGLGKRYEKWVRKAMQMNPKYAWGGPARALGRYYFTLPGIAGGDNAKAIKYLEESKRIAPEALRTRAWLAEVYLDEGERAKAKVELEFCMSAELKQGDLADNLRMQPECERLQKKLQ